MLQKYFKDVTNLLQPCEDVVTKREYYQYPARKRKFFFFICAEIVSFATKLIITCKEIHYYNLPEFL